MAEIIFDTAPGRPQHGVHDRDAAARRRRATGIDDLVANGVKVIADDIVPHHRAVLPGRHRRAGRRPREGRGRDVPRVGRQPRAPELGGHVRADDRPARRLAERERLRHRRRGRRHPDDRHVHEPHHRSSRCSGTSRSAQASTDLAVDVFAINAGVPTYAFTVDTDNLATGIPSEFVTILVTGTATLGIAIRRKAGTRDPFMKYIVGNAGPSRSPSTTRTRGAIDPDASSARGALTVAAVEPRDAGHARGLQLARPGVQALRRRRQPARRAGDPQQARPRRRRRRRDERRRASTRSSGRARRRRARRASPRCCSSAKPTLTADQLAAILKDAQPLDRLHRHGRAARRRLRVRLRARRRRRDGGAGRHAAGGHAGAQPAGPNGADGWFTEPVVGADVDACRCAVAGRRRPAATRRRSRPTRRARRSPAPRRAPAARRRSRSTIKRDASPPSAPAFAGIAAQTYTAAELPAAAAIGCTRATRRPA